MELNHLICLNRNGILFIRDEFLRWERGGGDQVSWWRCTFEVKPARTRWRKLEKKSFDVNEKTKKNYIILMKFMSIDDLFRIFFAVLCCSLDGHGRYRRHRRFPLEIFITYARMNNGNKLSRWNFWVRLRMWYVHHTYASHSNRPWQPRRQPGIESFPAIIMKIYVYRSSEDD